MGTFRRNVSKGLLIMKFPKNRKRFHEVMSSFSLALNKVEARHPVERGAIKMKMPVYF